MPPTSRDKTRVFIDSDVLVSGITSMTDYAASLVLLRLAEIDLIEAICSDQVIKEVENTLQEKMPEAVESFHALVERSIQIKTDPSPMERETCKELADEFYTPLLAVAIREQCTWLVTFSEGKFLPGHPDIMVVRPDELVSRLRGQFAWQGG